MAEFYKIFYSSKQEIPPSFYEVFEVFSKLEFPTYQEILIKRPHEYSKSFLIFKMLSLNLPCPLFIIHVNCYNRITNPLHYSEYEINKLKMYNLIN